MENQKLCPNCGYQVSSDDYYCPSCRHRIEFPTPASAPTTQSVPIQETADLSKTLIWSSLLYIISIILSTAQALMVAIEPGISGDLQSVIVMASVGVSSVSVIYLAMFLIAPSRRFRNLHIPMILTFLFGIANILILIGLASIYPFPGTLNSIVTSLGNSASTLLIASQYLTFFVTLGIAGFIGIFGIIGLLLVLHRSSKILSQPLVYYGMIAGILCTFIELFTGLPLFMIIPPFLIIQGARRSINSNFVPIQYI